MNHRLALLDSLISGEPCAVGSELSAVRFIDSGGYVSDVGKEYLRSVFRGDALRAWGLIWYPDPCPCCQAITDRKVLPLIFDSSTWRWRIVGYPKYPDPARIMGIYVSEADARRVL